MKNIIALTDYKKNFGSKWKAQPYRSGFDKNFLKKYFEKYDYTIEYIQLKDVEFEKSFWDGKLVIYTSSEEVGLNYKNYIEDIVLGLERLGAIIIPAFDFLRANNNKVYMEILREQFLGEELSVYKSTYYGTLDELREDEKQHKISFPCVIKTAAGAMSRGVFLANNENELIRYAKKISRSPNILAEIKERLRKRKYPGYKIESKYQNKFIVQPFIPNFKNDWKILVFGDHYYILNRGVKDKDFRASGSHYNYKAGSKSEFPLHLLDKVEIIYSKLDVPHLSLDCAYDGNNFYVFEFQAIYFGTSTMEFCDGFYTKENDSWVFKEQVLEQEEEYVRGVVHYLKNN